MTRISTSFSKKIPGRESYSSVGYQVTIEREIEEPEEELCHVIESLFGEARQAVELEITRDRGMVSRRRNHNGTGDRVHDADPAASDRQLQYLVLLATRDHRMTMDEFCGFVSDEVGVQRMSELSRRQASDLIDLLK